MALRFKRDELQEEYYSRPEFLQQICTDFVRLSNDFGIIPVVTRVQGPVRGSSGVHEAGRAVDFRDEHSGTRLYSPGQRMLILEYLNLKYRRRDRFQTIIWHSFNGGPHHFHIQLATSLDKYYNLNELNKENQDGN